MLTVRILCVGKCKEKYWREACAEYGKRLSAFCRFEVLEVDEERLPERPSKAQIESGLEQEGKRLLQKAGSTPIVALCIEGKELSSPQLAQYVERAAVNGASSLAFVIGGSWGLWEEVQRKAALRLSMSPMTFPHQLARVMLCEQIYRAFQIAHSGKYHK
ncbi:MAG: 23S rRNA (pseudouridine(1915)-N(3))-methyltransferase RlmH [[Clostridium] leptum]